MKAHTTLLQLKYDDVIETLAKRANVSVREALDIFYTSPVYEEISQGISDMHCRSDGYLADDIIALSNASSAVRHDQASATLSANIDR